MNGSIKSVAEGVARMVECGERERLWTFADFAGLPAGAVAVALSRMVREGKLRRARKGVYHRPLVTRFGELRPEPAEVAEAVLRQKGVEWRSVGLWGANRLGLTTQVSSTPTFATARRVSSLRTGSGRPVRVRVAPGIEKLTHDEAAALDALRNLKRIPDSDPDTVVLRLIEVFRAGRVNYGRVARAAEEWPPRVRALLGAIGEELGESPVCLDRLKRTLNPTTSFPLPLYRLATARNWRIVPRR